MLGGYEKRIPPISGGILINSWVNNGADLYDLLHMVAYRYASVCARKLRWQKGADAGAMGRGNGRGEHKKPPKNERSLAVSRA